MSPNLHLPSPTKCNPDNEPPPSSQRTTLDVAALASLAGLCDSCGNVPLDLCVPVLTRRQPSSAISRDEIFVLLYVDGIASIGQIAEETQLSLAETIAILVGLLTRGLVEMTTEPSPPG